MKRLAYKTEKIEDIILVCFVLHNVTQIKGEAYIGYDDIMDQVMQEEKTVTLKSYIDSTVQYFSVILKAQQKYLNLLKFYTANIPVIGVKTESRYSQENRDNHYYHRSILGKTTAVISLVKMQPRR